MSLGHARAPRRPGHLPRRRHARLGRGRPAGLPRAVARHHAAAGVEPRREADDELLRPVAGSARHAGLRQRLQDPVGSTSSATWSRTRRTAGRCPKAPRACSWSRPRCRAGRSGAGSTCRRCSSEAHAMTMHHPARRRRHAAALHAARHRPLHARRAGHAASTASPTPPRTWWPTRAPPSTRGCSARSTGTPPSPTASACGAGPGRGRGDGHGAARHGAGLADLAGADPPLDRRRARRARRLARQRLRHRPPGARGRQDGRRRDPRLRRADGGDREARRQAHRDGQPRAGARGARARPTTSASTTAC